MLKKYQLNDLYWLEVCSFLDKDAMNGRDFDADKKWVTTDGEEPEKFIYTTLAAKKFNLSHKYENPKAAIQQILIYAYTGEKKHLKDMFFKIIIP